MLLDTIAGNPDPVLDTLAAIYRVRLETLTFLKAPDASYNHEAAVAACDRISNHAPAMLDQFQALSTECQLETEAIRFESMVIREECTASEFDTIREVVGNALSTSASNADAYYYEVYLPALVLSYGCTDVNPDEVAIQKKKSLRASVAI
jgi:hypothetical protein